MNNGMKKIYEKFVKRDQLDKEKFDNPVEGAESHRTIINPEPEVLERKIKREANEFKEGIRDAYFNPYGDDDIRAQYIYDRETGRGRKDRDEIERLTTHVSNLEKRLNEKEELLVQYEVIEHAIIELCLAWNGIGTIENHYWLVDQILRKASDRTGSYRETIERYESDGCKWERGNCPE